MNRKILLHGFFRWLIFTVILFSFFAVCVAIFQISAISAPLYDDSDWDSGYVYQIQNTTFQGNIKFDAHSHTRVNGGFLTPEQNILWHLSQGFNSMVLTDHNTWKNIDAIRNIARTKYSDKIMVLAGVEYTTNRIHMNFIFHPNVTNEELFQIKRPRIYPTDAEIQVVINQVHDLEGIVIVNHIPWTARTFPGDQPTRSDLLDWGVDYIEVLNEDEWDHVSYDFCNANGIGIISGTDMHVPERTFGWTLFNTTEFSEEAIFDYLKQNSTLIEIIYEEDGSDYPFDHNPQPSVGAQILMPLYLIGEAVTNLSYPDPNVLGWLSVMLWINAIYFGRYLMKYIQNKRKSIEIQPN